MYNYKNERFWRKKVDWDNKNLVYTYHGYNIFPLTWEERERMPFYLQNNYYWDEIERIDRIIEMEEKSKDFNSEPAEIGFDLAMMFFDGDISEDDDMEVIHDQLLEKYKKGGVRVG